MWQSLVPKSSNLPAGLHLFHKSPKLLVSVTCALVGPATMVHTHELVVNQFKCHFCVATRVPTGHATCMTHATKCPAAKEGTGILHCNRDKLGREQHCHRSFRVVPIFSLVIRWVPLT